MAVVQALVSIRTFKKQAPEPHSCQHVCSRSLVHLVIKTSCVCHFSILLHTHLLNIAGSLRVAAPSNPPTPPPPPPPAPANRNTERGSIPLFCRGGGEGAGACRLHCWLLLTNVSHPSCKEREQSWATAA